VSGLSVVLRTRPRILADYVSSCGFSLMPVVYQVVGFGRGFGRHSGRRRRSVASSVKDDDVATAAMSGNESKIQSDYRLKNAKDFHVRQLGTP